MRSTSTTTLGAGTRWTSAGTYGARRVPCGLAGVPHTHDSYKESARCELLQLAQLAGEISDLEVHPGYDLVVAGMRIGRYRPDFRYRRAGALVVEDVKSTPTKTEAYGLRKRLLKALYGLDVLET